MKKFNHNFTVAIIFTFFVVLTRLIPHLSNFTPIFALGIFTTVLFKNRTISLALVLGAMLVTDIFIGFYPEVWAVYASTIIAIGLSTLFTKNPSFLKLGISSLSAPTIFFVLSNLAVWFAWYPHSFEGLSMCYFNAIPFYGYSLISTFAYTFAFFSIYKIVTKQNLVLVSEK